MENGDFSFTIHTFLFPHVHLRARVNFVGGARAVGILRACVERGLPPAAELDACA